MFDLSPVVTQAMTKLPPAARVQGKLNSRPNFTSISDTFNRALLATFNVLKALAAPSSSWALPKNCWSSPRPLTAPLASVPLCEYLHLAMQTGISTARPYTSDVTKANTFSPHITVSLLTLGNSCSSRSSTWGRRWGRPQQRWLLQLLPVGLSKGILPVLSPVCLGPAGVTKKVEELLLHLPGHREDLALLPLGAVQVQHRQEAQA